MPKLKTKKGVAKRFRRRKSGSIKYKSAYVGHLLSGKAKNRKRRHKSLAGSVSQSDLSAIKKQMPYG
ncbi:MAG: 50S ribosomal protein L35 [Candidatus Omnitrophica bacterium CG11_big_fil_rev_8_21_14_0_20_42_13]|uniref:Large ribosomal subunit protein bL35 n=1 Tax=Candidatus Ghiorseimicrobium undicola TaxID=1974746 RepID=A0A2H0LXP5_9BACT|nr:MAG: 50S ribosomal protein L35 [Candidatus Omnitrophica bacterium CG11_big_fil_rev_8_21_14_0_20_42_13]